MRGPGKNPPPPPRPQILLPWEEQGSSQVTGSLNGVDAKAELRGCWDYYDVKSKAAVESEGWHSWLTCQCNALHMACVSFALHHQVQAQTGHDD